MLIRNPYDIRRMAPIGMAIGVVAVGIAAGLVVNKVLRAPNCSVGSGGGTAAGVRYLERMRGSASPDEKLPMVILFHSKGATPEGYAGSLAGIGKARLIIPQGILETKSGYEWWTRGVVNSVGPSELSTATSQWATASDRVAQFIHDVAACRPTMGKPIVTGSSQGGEISLLIASRVPRKVHGGVAVSSYLLEPFWNSKMAPVVMIHGTGDKTVPFQWAKDYAQAMSQQGAPIRFEEFASSGHSVTSGMGRSWIANVRSMVDQIWKGS